MSEPKKRKVHTPEYKAKVALEALRSGPDGHPNCSTCGQSNCSTWPPANLMC